MNEIGLEWNVKYELGVKEIDFQHQYFLASIKRISSQLKSSDDSTFHASLIAELNAYAKFHFLSEENLMAQYGYPGLAEHKKNHQNLIQQLNIKQFWSDGKLSEEKVDELSEFLVHWFFDHTSVVDKRFAEFLDKNRK